jgi:hypothetical protein
MPYGHSPGAMSTSLMANVHSVGMVHSRGNQIRGFSKLIDTRAGAARKTPDRLQCLTELTEQDWVNSRYPHGKLKKWDK